MTVEGCAPHATFLRGGVWQLTVLPQPAPYRTGEPTGGVLLSGCELPLSESRSVPGSVLYIPYLLRSSQ